MQKNEIVTLTVEEINNLGCGVGHLQNPDGSRGLVVFVQGAVTGDELEARIIKLNKSYLVARIERILKPSPYRETDVDCTARGCGGCVYRHVLYSHECDLKREYVQNAFRKAGLSDVTVERVQTTDVLTEYRNKAQYPVARGRDGKTVYGFFANSTHRVVSAEGCRLQPRIFSEIASFVCSFADQTRMSVYDEESGRGFLRHIYLRMGQRTGEIMLCLVANGTRFDGEARFVVEINKRFPQIKSLYLNTNTKNTNVVLGSEYRLLDGCAWIEDELCGVRFRISPAAFYQVNHDACELLYGIAKEKAGLTGKEILLDLYCGIGTIGLSMADRAGEIVGIEIVEDAVVCARENAARNGVANAYFYCGDASDAKGLLKTAEEAHGSVAGATVIMDPPRKGSTPELIRYLAERGFDRIVYVSCNPDTLARDCVLFRELGYEIGAVTPVDMFPRTGHVETVTLLSRKIDVHKMKLNSTPFEMIKSGEKTIELRLYDEKRQQIKVGDKIVFTNNTTEETLNTTVIKLHRFDNFDELYKLLPLLKCGYTTKNVDKANSADMEQYYSVEEQKKYGVVGIELCRPKQIKDESVVCLTRRTRQ